MRLLNPDTASFHRESIPPSGSLSSPAAAFGGGEAIARETPLRLTPGRKLLDRVREVLRLRHLSRKTETAYVGWIRRFILFHGKRHPKEMGAPETQADGRAGRDGRRCALAMVLVLLLGCSKSSTRPTGGTATEPKPREETKSTGAMGPVNHDLKRVQRRLKELGHDPGPIDGRLGLQTQAALKAFQTDYGLAATGEIDAETRAALGFGRKTPP